MKKATLIAIKNALTDYGYMDSDVLSELNREITKGEAEKAKNAEAYEALHDVIMENLGEIPCTVAELWDVIKKDVPEGTTKNKVQYALNHLWQDEIVKIEGRPNGYRKA